MENIKSANKRLLELDALRGFAAMFVVLFHFTKRFSPSELGFRNFGLQYGATGVELFFMISGFVIFMSIVKLNNGKEFIINRIARLYPAYWASAVLIFTLIVFTQKVFFHHWIEPNIVGRFFVNLSMLQYVFHVKDLDGPYWTLIIEIMFYVFIWILFISKLIRHIEKISLGILSFILATYIINYYFSISLSGLFSAIPLLHFFPLFYAGIIFYKMFAEKETIYRYFILILCFYAQAMQFPDRGFPAISWMEYNIILFVYFIIFMLFVKNKLDFIVNKVTVYLGSISYALYLVNDFISESVLLPAFIRRVHMPFIFAAIITMCIVLFIAHVITKKIDIPYRYKIRDFLRKHT